jgi:hypothetical protein
MGRWDSYREQQEDVKRQEDKNAERRKPDRLLLVPKQDVLNQFAACIWRKAPEKARIALSTGIDTPDERAALNKVAQIGGCSGRSNLSGASGEFRGALAEAGIRADAERRVRIGSLDAVPATRVASATGRSFVTSYASCIASANPSGSLALLATALGSEDEKSAVLAMAPALTACMPEGTQYRLNLRDVRNHIADALYRMSEAPNA